MSERKINLYWLNPDQIRLVREFSTSKFDPHSTSLEVSFRVFLQANAIETTRKIIDGNKSAVPLHLGELALTEERYQEICGVLGVKAITESLISEKSLGCILGLLSIRNQT